MTSPFAWPMIILVKGYRRFISPFTGPRCKYYPTCSTYALEVYRIHGLLKGTLLSTWRLLRCNPFSLGGVDYPPPKGTWRRPAYHQMSDEELAEHWARLEQERNTGRPVRPRDRLGRSDGDRNQSGD